MNIQYNHEQEAASSEVIRARLKDTKKMLTMCRDTIKEELYLTVQNIKTEQDKLLGGDSWDAIEESMKEINDIYKEVDIHESIEIAKDMIDDISGNIEGIMEVST